MRSNTFTSIWSIANTTLVIARRRTARSAATDDHWATADSASENCSGARSWVEISAAAFFSRQLLRSRRLSARAGWGAVPTSLHFGCRSTRLRWRHKKETWRCLHKLVWSADLWSVARSHTVRWRDQRSRAMPSLRPACCTPLSCTRNEMSGAAREGSDAKDDVRLMRCLRLN